MTPTETIELPYVQRHLASARRGWQRRIQHYKLAMEALVVRGEDLILISPSPPTGRELAALQTLRHHMVAELFEAVWTGRAAMRSIRDETLDGFRKGGLCAAVPVGQAAVCLAEAVAERSPCEQMQALVHDAVMEWIATLEPEERRRFLERGPQPICNHDEGVTDLRLASLVYEAGCQLRSHGRLEAAYFAFSLSRVVWFSPVLAAPDEVLPMGSAPSRFGIPIIHSWRGHSGFSPTWDFPRTSDVDLLPWTWWDHVVGCGTTITHRVLTEMGVPAHKQHIVEVHREAPWLGQRVPRLRGRVAIVDDVNEGFTSWTLARLWNADVVALDGGYCAHGYTRFRPAVMLV